VRCWVVRSSMTRRPCAMPSRTRAPIGSRAGGGIDRGGERLPHHTGRRHCGTGSRRRLGGARGGHKRDRLSLVGPGAAEIAILPSASRARLTSRLTSSKRVGRTLPSTSAIRSSSTWALGGGDDGLAGPNRGSPRSAPSGRGRIRPDRSTSRRWRIDSRGDQRFERLGQRLFQQVDDDWSLRQSDRQPGHTDRH